MTLDIMMPFYGSFDHLKLAVASVLAQSDPDWRLTVIDDMYPDRTPGEWVKAIPDNRVTYIRNETNLRPSRNYIKSVGIASSEFVQIMGCDDQMLPRYVARIHEIIASFPEADVIQPGVSVIDENGLPNTPLADRVKALLRFRGDGARAYGGEELAISLLRGNWTYFPSLVWRRDLLVSFGFRTDLDVVQDLAMLLEITKAGGSLVLDDEVVFNYRRHSGSVSAQTGTDGSKFRQERTLFYEAAAECKVLGWNHASRIAQRHIASRLNALSELPGALRSGNDSGRRALVEHILRRSYKS